MSSLAWFWLILIIILVAGCIQQIRSLLATPEDWTATVSTTSKSMEGHHAADPENR
jgi:hypothetical protein